MIAMESQLLSLIVNGLQIFNKGKIARKGSVIFD